MTEEKHVIFGAGPLGKTVMEELLLQGKKVTMVNRSEKAGFPPVVPFIVADAANSEKVAEICRDAAVVYNCIGLPYAQWELLPQIMDGLIKGISQTNAVLVYADNLYPYGPTQGKMTEDAAYQPVGRKTSIRAEVADKLIHAQQKGIVKAVIGRAPDFYGPGVKQSILGDRVIGNLIQGKPAEVMGHIDVPHSVIYIKDFARGLITLGTNEKAIGGIWHIPCAPTLTLREHIESFALEINATVKYRTANRFILKILSIFNRDMKEFKEIYYQFHDAFIVGHQKFNRSFDFEVTPHETARRETVQWYLKESALKAQIG